MSKEADEAGAALLKLFGVIGVYVVMSMLRAATLTAFWAWYAVPVFHLPALRLWTAYGCILLVGMFTGPGSTEKEMASFGATVGRSLAWLGMAWALAGILNLVK